MGDGRAYAVVVPVSHARRNAREVARYETTFELSGLAFQPSRVMKNAHFG
jgi:hypothetical protein